MIGNVNWDFDSSSQPQKVEQVKTFDFDSYAEPVQKEINLLDDSPP